MEAVIAFAATFGVLLGIVLLGSSASNGSSVVADWAKDWH